jgi:hypothetical protein
MVRELNALEARATFATAMTAGTSTRLDRCEATVAQQYCAAADVHAATDGAADARS